jgi:hypothetical protein
MKDILIIFCKSIIHKKLILILIIFFDLITIGEINK